jgi:hypothetical protein
MSALTAIAIIACLIGVAFFFKGMSDLLCGISMFFQFLAGKRNFDDENK